MRELTRPIFGYTDVAWLDALPAYNPNPFSEEILDGLRKIQESGSYYFKATCIPKPGQTVIAPFDSFEDEISIEPGSILTMITAYTLTGVVGNEPGFKCQIYDKGSKTTLFSSTFGKSGSIVGPIQQGADLYGNLYRGPHILASPFIILWPGQLNVTVRNMASVNNDIQLGLFLAVPVTTKSIGTLENRPVS